MKNLSTVLIILILTSRVGSEDPVMGALDQALGRVGKLPIHERKAIISWIYKEVYPNTPFFVGEGGFGGMGMMGLVPTGKPGLAKLLAKHKDILAPLLKADLQSRKKDSIQRALDVIENAGLVDFFDPVADLFRKNKAFADEAAHTLTCLGGPLVIRLLIEKNPQEPLHYEDHLRSLSQYRRADPLLVKLLHSKDAFIRAKTCHILGESGDEALVPEVIRLVKDSDANVRLFAARIGFRFFKESFARVRPALITLLTDKNVEVRLSISQSFAEKGDKVCARTLLELLQDKSIRTGDIDVYWRDGRWLWHSVRILSGIDSPVYDGSEVEKEAIRRFAVWVKKNGLPP